MLTLFVAGAAARAGSDLMPAGRGELIESLAFSESSVYLDERGAGRAAPVWRTQELSSFIQWGASDAVTFLASSAVERIAPGQNAQAAGLEPTELGARFAVARASNASLAFQASVLAPSAPAALVRTTLTARDPGADVRILIFREFKVFGASAFAEIQAGWRLIGYRGVSESHADATVGARPAKRWLLLFQSFGTASKTPSGLVATYGRPAFEKLQISAVYDLDRNWSAQGGLFATVAGRDARRDHGALVALWRRF